MQMPSSLESWIEGEQGRFALFLPVAMAVGVALYFQGTTEPPLWTGPATILCATLTAFLVRRWRVAHALSLLILAIGLGYASIQFTTWRSPAVIEVPTRATIVTGIVAAVETLPAGRRVLIRKPHFDVGPPMARTVRIRLRPGDATPLATGDTIRVRALLSRPSSPAYPGGWDLQRDAYFAGIGAFGYALNPSEQGDSPARDRIGWVQRLREIIAGRIAPHLNGATGAIAATLLTGSTTAIPPDDRAAFRDSGLAHLLAIAGLHIGIVMGLVLGATRSIMALSERAALRWPLKSIAAFAALAVGGCYLILTGAHVPILRSFAMASMVTLGVLVGRQALSLRSLALAMAAIVMIAPNEVVGVSFQMSFSAVLALIVGYAALRPWLSALHGESWPRRVGSHVVALALTSALAGSFSAPYGAYHFGHVQIYFVLANMVAVPITAMLVMPAALIALALMPLHLEGLALAPMGWGIDATLWIAHTVAALPDATLAVPHMPTWGLLAYSGGLAWLGLWRCRLRFGGIFAMVAGLASPVFDTPPDILVSADARLIAYHADDTMLLQKTNGGSAFTQDAWQQFWATDKPLTLECAATHCLMKPQPGRTSALLLRGDPDKSVCDQKLLISAEPIRLRCPEKIPWIDRFTVWRNGAHAVWLGPDSITVISDRSVRGDRPWVLGLPLAGRTPPNTRTALAEPLPPAAD